MDEERKEDEKVEAVIKRDITSLGTIRSLTIKKCKEIAEKVSRRNEWNKALKQERKITRKRVDKWHPISIDLRKRDEKQDTRIFAGICFLVGRGAINLFSTILLP